MIKLMLALRKLPVLLLSISLGNFYALNAFGNDSGYSQPSVSDFRNSFYTYLKDSEYSKYSDEDIHSLVYLPTAEAQNPMASYPEFSDAKSQLSFLDSFFKTLKPSDQYFNGLQTPFQSIKDMNAVFERTGPVTVVVLPGIFGEFIETYPFQEVFSEPNTAAKLEWEQKFSAHPITDFAFSEEALQFEKRPLKDLIEVGSIDDGNGKPLIKLVFLKANTGSLETLGRIENNSRVYKRRLDRFFSVMGIPKRFYLLGYSRGSRVALEIASTIDTERQKLKHPWAKSLHGVITLGGVNYGTPVADQLDAKGVSPKNLSKRNPFAKLGALVQKSAIDLKSCETQSNYPSLGVALTNTWSWIRNGSKLTKLLLQLPTHEEIQQEGISAQLPDSGRFYSLIKSSTYDTVNFMGTGFVCQYCKNVERFKKLVDLVYDGVEVLQTEASLDWWANHTLPVGFKIFTLEATQADAFKESQSESIQKLVRNPLAYDLGSQDDKSLRQNYYDLLSVSETELNDGQVPYHRARIWPQVNVALNPKHASLRVFDVGLFGTHHWGFAFPYAVPMKNPRTGKPGAGNPFPRSAMLFALGRFIAQSEAADGLMP